MPCRAMYQVLLLLTTLSSIVTPKAPVFHAHLAHALVVLCYACYVLGAAYHGPQQQRHSKRDVHARVHQRPALTGEHERVTVGTRGKVT